MKKALVAYFSASGETEKLARTIAGVTGGALFESAPQSVEKVRLELGFF